MFGRQWRDLIWRSKAGKGEVREKPRSQENCIENISMAWKDGCGEEVARCYCIVTWREHENVFSYSGAFYLDGGQEREMWKLGLVVGERFLGFHLNANKHGFCWLVRLSCWFSSVKTLFLNCTSFNELILLEWLHDRCSKDQLHLW